MQNSKFINRCEKIIPTLLGDDKSVSNKSDIAYSCLISTNLDVILEMEKAFPKEFGAFYINAKKVEQVLTNFDKNARSMNKQHLDALMHIMGKIDLQKTDIANAVLRSLILSDEQLLYNDESIQSEIEDFLDYKAPIQREVASKKEEMIKYFYKIVHPALQSINNLFLEKTAKGEVFFDKNTISFLNSIEPINDSAGIINMFTYKLFYVHDEKVKINKNIEDPLLLAPKMKDLCEAEQDFYEEVLARPVIKNLMSLENNPNNIKFIMGSIVNHFDNSNRVVLDDKKAFDVFTKELSGHQLKLSDWNNINSNKYTEREFVYKIKELLAYVLKTSILRTKYEGGEFEESDKKVFKKSLTSILKDSKSKENKAIKILNILVNNNLINIKEYAAKSKKILEDISRHDDDFSYLQPNELINIFSLAQDHMSQVTELEVQEVKKLFTVEGWNKVFLEKSVSSKNKLNSELPELNKLTKAKSKFKI